MKNQNNIPELPKLSQERYENIFNVYEVTNGQDVYYYYNILTKVVLPKNISSAAFTQYKISKKYPWTTISHRIYGTQHLWWLIILASQIKNPVQMPEPGSIITVIKPEYVNNVLNTIQDVIK